MLIVDNGRLRSLISLAIQALWLGVTAALAALWLVAAGAQRSDEKASGTSSDCTSYGKGGSYCAAPTNAEPKYRPDCANYGRAGRLCSAMPRSRAIDERTRA
jgi:hypothetical protein